MFGQPSHFSALVVIFVLMGGALFLLPLALPQYEVACTAEAKQCPDGSYVGRSGPRCEFEACPLLPCEKGGECPDSADGSSKEDPPAGGEKGILPYYSGVRGVVLLGPTCPVQREPPDGSCADKPYATLIAAFRADDPVHAFAISRSKVDGTYELSLPPGEYLLTAGESSLPRCEQQKISVGADSYVEKTIHCDTGIR